MFPQELRVCHADWLCASPAVAKLTKLFFDQASIRSSVSIRSSLAAETDALERNRTADRREDAWIALSRRSRSYPQPVRSRLDDRTDPALLVYGDGLSVPREALNLEPVRLIRHPAPKMGAVLTSIKTGRLPGMRNTPHNHESAFPHELSPSKKQPTRKLPQVEAVKLPQFFRAAIQATARDAQGERN